MRIQDLFERKVDRPIDGVIKADDARNLKTELEEYVFTRDVIRGLGNFTERFLTELTANGVWISGFFGSGKSHLLKMLSLLLEDAPLESGERPSELLLPRLDDEILKADLIKCASVPSRSVLFNIDQKFDGIGGDQSAPILEVFVKVLNELQGYFGKQGYIAKFEQDLDLRGEFESFKQTYLRINGNPWESDREAIATVRRTAFARAYADHFGTSEEEARKVMQQAREDYRVSIESFAHMVKAYIDRQPAGFRLNFFVDEVGQFVGQNSKLMLNLQTVAETLATVCNGRAWVFVTSQADLEGVLGGFKDMKSEDLSKIQGRFKTRLTLASADVREVIQKRLLAKKEDEPEVLTTIYDRERDNLQTLYRFGDNSRQFNGWRGSDAFCDYYPFHPYQFELFQLAIKELSAHNAFTGKYMSVGERSMLEVFQEAVVELKEAKVGRLATFDLLYDGLSATIRGDMQTTIKQAERHLGDGLPLRILKALFLLKWVREFKATPRNVAILLIDRPDIDIRSHEQEVRESLAELESQSFLQRNGDVYEFLTNVEQDIEVEIKNTDIDESQVMTLLGDVLFKDVLRDPKIRYEGNNQDYVYARKLDDQLVGRDADVAINVVTTDHPHHGDSQTLAMQNSGKAELLAILPSETRLIEHARLFLKTQKYVQQNSASGDPTRKSILDQRAQQNSQRRSDMQQLAGELLRKAPLYLNAQRLDMIGEGEARNRFAKAAQELISFAYPNLRMLKGSYSEATLHDALTAADDLLSGGGHTLSEAEQEILTYVMRNQNEGERTSIEAMIRHFGKRPYGWYPMAVLTLTARLFRMGKVELRTGELLDAQAAYDYLKNSRQHGSVRVRLQEEFDASAINSLKNFHHEFFDRPNPGNDARAVGQFTVEAMAKEAEEVETLLDQAGRYPFLEALRPLAGRLRELGKRDHAYVLKHLADFEDELLTAKDDVLGPIKAFMHGPQRAVYDEVMAFLKDEQANFAELPAEEVQPLRELEEASRPYLGGKLPAAKAAMQKLRGLLDEKITNAREEALTALEAKEAQLKSSSDFLELEDDDRECVLRLSEQARSEIASARFVTSIRDRVSRYVNQDYPAQLQAASRLVAKRERVVTGDGEPELVREPPVRYTPSTALKVHCKLPFISNETELEEWLDALRAAAKAELEMGNRISL